MAGIRGFTASDQDARFGNKQKKLLQTMKFPPEFDKKARGPTILPRDFVPCRLCVTRTVWLGAHRFRLLPSRGRILGRKEWSARFRCGSSSELHSS